MYRTGKWGSQAKNRSKERLEYFKKYQKENYKPRGNNVGFVGEVEALNKLVGSRKFNRKIDLIWKDKKIDVKTSKPKKRDGTWNFLLYRQKGCVDYFLIICKDEHSRTKYMFLIPDGELKHNNLTISETTVYKFINFIIK